MDGTKQSRKEQCWQYYKSQMLYIEAMQEAKDCNVTGTDTGTPDNPKFSLKLLWEFCLLPSLDALVAAGGICEGAIVVHQEDNAGKSLLLP